MRKPNIKQLGQVSATLALITAGVILITVDKTGVKIIGILLILYAILDYMATEVMIMRYREDAIYMAEIEKQLDQKNRAIDKSLLESYGFNIVSTKDKTYATHINGVSMAQVEGSTWAIYIREGKTMWADTIENMSQLESFCSKHNKQIKLHEDEHSSQTDTKSETI